MFDLEKARQKGISEYQIKIMRDINENTIKEEACSKHDFEKVKVDLLYKYRCKNCGCIGTFRL